MSDLKGDGNLICLRCRNESTMGTVAWLRDILTQFPDHVEVVLNMGRHYDPVRNAHWELMHRNPKNPGEFLPHDEEAIRNGERLPSEDEVKVLITEIPYPASGYPEEPPDQEYDPAIEGVGNPYNYNEDEIVEDYDPFME